MSKKMHFHYSVMNAGKSTQILQIRHNYIENGDRVLLFTSSIDNRNGIGYITSRMGLSAEAIALSDVDNLYEIVKREHEKEKIEAILIDEVQFLNKEQIIQASDIADYLNITVMCYGLKNNIFGELFSESIKTLLAYADQILEIKQICHCKNKATMILKYDPSGNVIKSGNVIEIGDEGTKTKELKNRYISVCRKCWKDGNIGPSAKKLLIENNKNS